MKSYKTYFILLLIFFMASCQKDHDVEIVNIGAEFFISATDITSLDNQVTFTIENQQKNLAQVSVTLLGDADVDLGTIELADGAGTKTFTDVQLGFSDTVTEATVKFGAENNGIAFTRSKSVEVSNPISIVAPEVTHKADVAYLHFSIVPVVATINTVTIQSKVSALGTFENVAGDFNPMDSVAIVGADYSIYDTLFVKVIGAAGTKTAETVTEIVIMPDMAEAHSFTLMMDEGYDMVNDTLVALADPNADIIFTGVYGATGVMVGFDLPHAEFIMATEDEYSIADRMTISMVDFSNAITMNNNVAGGEIFFYRTRHDAADEYSYGMLKIMNVDKPQGVLENSSIEYEFKY